MAVQKADLEGGTSTAIMKLETHRPHALTANIRQRRHRESKFPVSTALWVNSSVLLRIGIL